MKNQGSLRTGCLCLGLCLIFVMLCPAVGIAGLPTLGTTHRGSGPPAVLLGDRDGWWDEPPDFNGEVLDSEIIGVFGLETEVANDFYSTSPTTIFEAVWWGEYYNNDGTGPNVSAFNLRFYDDAGGVPSSIVAEYLESVPMDTFTVGQGTEGPVYEYHAAVSANIGAGTYWFSVQACDHVFPPQWGRVAAGQVTGHQATFRSEYFSFPDWTRSVEVFGVALDASQRFYAAPPIPGACCFIDLRCESLMPVDCRRLGGAYQGPESSCDPNPCPSSPMACCFPDGHCERNVSDCVRGRRGIIRHRLELRSQSLFAALDGLLLRGLALRVRHGEHLLLRRWTSTRLPKQLRRGILSAARRLLQSSNGKLSARG